MQSAPRVFLSGTRSDLADFWPVAIEVCRKLDLFPVNMDAFPARPVDGTAASKEELEGCDLYVGVVAHKYGPVTHEEFEHAGETGVARLCFLIDPNADWSGERESKRPDLWEAFREQIAGSVSYATFRGVESFRAELTKTLQKWLAKPTKPLRELLLSGRLELPQRWTPGRLLTAGFEVIPFETEARRHELESLEAWCDEPDSANVLLITGPGGAGKTRLAIEACQRRLPGWASGFLRNDADRRDLDPLFETGPPRLVVIDYAETRLELVRLLLQRLADREALRPRLRVLLLARRSGDWWQQLAGTSDSLDNLLANSPEPMALDALIVEIDDRPAALLRAVHAFADRLEVALPDPLPQPDLSDETFERALYLHMAALAAVEGETVRRGRDALERTLLHERRFWRREAEELAGDQMSLCEALAKAFESCVAALTLVGGIEAGDGLLSPWLADLDHTQRQSALARLRRLYQGTGGRLEPLQPDLLGEELVHQTLAQDLVIFAQTAEKVQ